MKRLTIKIDDTADGKRAESLIKGQLMASDTYLRRLKGIPLGITLNGAHARSTDIVKKGDVLSILISDYGLDRPKGKPMPLNIVYEDEWLIIINKAAGMAVHSSTRDADLQTVEDALYAYLKEDEFPHPVSRLDKGTTGLMLVAKSGYMHALLKKQMEQGGFFKKYVALTYGVPSEKTGSITLSIGFEEGSHYKRGICDGGSAAKSDYRVLYEKGGIALVELTPKTGRTHQLRVHMAAIGCPLVGDWLYGHESDVIHRPALHACELKFTHPITGENLHLNAPMPSDMEDFFERLKN